MSLETAVSVIYQVMDDLGLTRLEKGRILATLGSHDDDPMAEAVWIETEKRLKERGIAVAPVAEDDGA